MNIRKTFRIWWQKPVANDDFHSHREVSFLELFYDLIYVVLIAEIAHHFTHNLNLTGLWQFVLLMGVMLWTWFSGMIYHCHHGTDDISMRVFTFIQMFLTGGMAIFVPQVFEGGASPFGLLFACFLLLFSALWARTGFHNPERRAAAYPVAFLYVVLVAAIVLASQIAEPNVQYVLWGGTVLLGLMLPYCAQRISNLKNVLDMISTHNSASIERFGLLVIIALGESVVSLIEGIASFEIISLRLALLGILGMSMAVSVWWFYFDFISRRLPWKGHLNNNLYTLLHFPLIMSITSIGAVLREMITHNDQTLADSTRWFLVGSVAILMALMALLIQLVEIKKEKIKEYTDIVSKVFIPLTLITASIGFTNFGHITILVSLNILLIIPVLLSTVMWVKTRLREVE